MMQIVQLTREQRIEMYLKLSKRELVDMLMANQDLVAGYMMRPQVPALTATPMGCVCPPGTVCANNMCPRRPFPGPSWGATCGLNGQATS